MQVQGWQQQRDETINAKLEHMALVARERFEADQNLQKMHRTLPKEPSQYTPLQLELFSVNPRDFDFVEKCISKLPRQRQREHFRKLYLQAYHSVKDDGSIAFHSGNKQCRYANNYLYDVLETRLKQVFKQYRIDLNFIEMFKKVPEWQLDLQNLLEKKRKTKKDIAAIENIEWNKVNAKYQGNVNRELKKATLPFYLIGERKLKNIAYQIAKMFSFYQLEYVKNITMQSAPLSADDVNQCIFRLYKKCGEIAKSIGFPLPYWGKVEQDKPIKGEQVDIALNKVVCEKYWFRQMHRTQKRMVEHIAIACGEVRKQASSYISHAGFYQWGNQQRKSHDYLKAMILENVDNPAEQVELFDTYLKSSSNPALRRNEMMVRLRGIEEWAEENGNEALFLTLTAPSSYHATNSKTGNNNKKWQGASPRQTQAYLNKVWQQFRAMLAKRDIKIYGMRVAEPHHDGTPHWHLLTYVKSKHKETVIELFKKKALEIDGNEKGARTHRCRVEACDKTKGSATAYISKYISKNIDGFALAGEMSDEDPRLSLQDNAKRVRAWASMWGLRQFQFYGAASISVWRELRRLVAGQAEDEIIEKALAAADVGCYASYFDLQGGAFAKRTDQPIKLDYEQKEANQYGEKRQSIIGLANRFSLKNVISRTKKWAIKKRPSDFNTNTAERSEAQNSERSSPWTCVSNCNRSEIAQQVNLLIRPIRPPLNEQKLDYLFKYKRLNLNKNTAVILEDEQPRLIKRNQNMITDFGSMQNLPRNLQKLRNLHKQ